VTLAVQAAYGRLVSIDHLGETPVYLQLCELLRDRIRSGELEIGRPLPSLPQLMQQYGISRGTAAKAVGVLREEGIVRIVPGRGAFVIAKPGKRSKA
jgi:GntR family transcriptional regulator